GNRNRVGRQGNPGDNITGQPGNAIFSQPTDGRKPPKPSCRFVAFRRNCHAAGSRTGTDLTSISNGVNTLLDPHQAGCPEAFVVMPHTYAASFRALSLIRPASARST